MYIVILVGHCWWALRSRKQRTNPKPALINLCHQKSTGSDVADLNHILGYFDIRFLQNIYDWIPSLFLLVTLHTVCRLSARKRLNERILVPPRTALWRKKQLNLYFTNVSQPLSLWPVFKMLRTSAVVAV